MTLISLPMLIRLDPGRLLANGETTAANRPTPHDRGAGYERAGARLHCGTWCLGPHARRPSR
jgi:hypothetical protein